MFVDKGEGFPYNESIMKKGGVSVAEVFHNVGILAHVDSGKTTLTEQILYRTGCIRQVGSVDEGTSARYPCGKTTD